MEAILTAQPQTVPALLDGLEAIRDDVLPHLRVLWEEEEQAQTRVRRGRVAMALLPVEPIQVKDWLAAWLLQVDDPGEMLLVRDTLKPHSGELRTTLWQRADDVSLPAQKRFRALVALATYDANNRRWGERATFVIEQLLTANPLHLGSWVEAFRPLRAALIRPLLETKTRGHWSDQQKHLASTLLADYARDQPQVIADLMLRTQSENKLQQLALAMHNYHSMHKHLPLLSITSKAGTPQLSWRVALLPYIEQDSLFKEFKLDEPWDSPHNLKLLSKMPKVYAHPVKTQSSQPFSTHYQVFVGKDAPFLEGRKVRMPASFADGTANTIIIVEAADAVPWSKPADLVYDANKPLPKLGGLFDDGFYVALGDASVRWISSKTTERTLRAAITPSGGETLGPDW